MAWKFNPFTEELDYYEIGESSNYVLKTGDTMTGNLDMSLNEIKNMKIDVLSSLPSAGNTGRIIYYTGDLHLYLDQG